MKKLTLSLLSILFLALSTSPVLAQFESGEATNTIDLSDAEEEQLRTVGEEAEIIDMVGLRADFKQNTQDPSSKIVRFEMLLTSNVQSDRVKVQWGIRGDSSYVDESQREIDFSVEPGRTYSIPLEVIPLSNGITEVYGRAQVFGAESNLVATVRKNYASNINREILPLTDEYKSALTQNTIQNILIYIVILIVAAVLGVIGLKEFAKWYKRD